MTPEEIRRVLAQAAYETRMCGPMMDGPKYRDFCGADRILNFLERYNLIIVSKDETEAHEDS